MDNIKKLMKEYWRFGIIAVLVVAVAIGVIKFGGDALTDTTAETETELASVAETEEVTSEIPTTVIETTIEETISLDLQKDIYPEINALLQRYFDAKFNSDVETLQQIVIPSDGYTKERLDEERYGRAGEDGFNEIERYEIVSCYTKPGLDDETYVVWVHFNIKYLNAQTVVPGLQRFYICTNENGLYIYNSEFEQDIVVYLDEISNKSDVLDLIAMINQSYQDALSYDAELNAIFSRMQEAVALYAQETAVSPEAETTVTPEAETTVTPEAETTVAVEPETTVS